MKKESVQFAIGKIVLGALLILLTCTVSLEAGDSAAEIIEKIQKKYDQVRNAAIAFTQNVKFSLSRAEYSSKGTIYMKKANHYRIETEDRTFVTDGKTVWSYSPTNRQVLIDSYKDDPRSFSPERFLLSVPKDYFAVVLGKERLQKREVVVLKLTPKDEASLTKSLKLWVDDGQWLLWKTELIDANDNVTVYTVTDIRLNTALSDSTFIFVPPADVEIVDLR